MIIILKSQNRQDEPIRAVLSFGSSCSNNGCSWSELNLDERKEGRKERRGEATWKLKVYERVNRNGKRNARPWLDKQLHVELEGFLVISQVEMIGYVCEVNSTCIPFNPPTTPSLPASAPPAVLSVDCVPYFHLVKWDGILTIRVHLCVRGTPAFPPDRLGSAPTRVISCSYLRRKQTGVLKTLNPSPNPPHPVRHRGLDESMKNSCTCLSCFALSSPWPSGKMGSWKCRKTALSKVCVSLHIPLKCLTAAVHQFMRDAERKWVEGVRIEGSRDSQHLRFTVV